jgi:quinol monooxygenase YgiN
MPYTGPSFSLHVKITVAPENAQKFLDALKPAYDAVTAEPECIFFEVYQSEEEPGVFKFVENWNASKDWMMNVSIAER